MEKVFGSHDKLKILIELSDAARDYKHGYFTLSYATGLNHILVKNQLEELENLKIIDSRPGDSILKRINIDDLAGSRIKEFLTSL